MQDVQRNQKTLVTHMEKNDKRLIELENKFINKELNTEDNAKKYIQNGDIPTQIKNSKNQVIIALRDYWISLMSKRFDSIETRFDSSEACLESIIKK